MARPRKPAAVMEAQGNPSHIPRDALELRKEAEAAVPAGVPAPPAYLTRKPQRELFGSVVKMLSDVGIVTELDGDCIGRYVVAYGQWVDASRMLRRVMTARQPDLDEVAKATRFQDAAFRQVRAAASDIGLTIEARCRLVAPPRPEPAENRFSRFAGGEAAPDGR